MLYRLAIPSGRIHCMSWSDLDFIAVSVSVDKENSLDKDYEM